MRKILYLGTDPTHCRLVGDITHYPIIEVVPRVVEQVQSAYCHFADYTHLVFTSKHAVAIACDHMQQLGISLRELQDKHILAIGRITAQTLSSRGLCAHHVADPETQEGLIQLIDSLDCRNSYFFLPRSSLSRSALTDYLRKQQISYCACDSYDTITRRNDHLPKIDNFDLIVFTSPSTVRGFIEVFGSLPALDKVVAIGPVTHRALRLEVFMKIKGIRISDKKNNIVSVELPDILIEISNGNSLYWSVLYLYATGRLGENKSMPALEEQIKNSERGLCISWDELNNLAKKFWDLIDITIIGCSDKSLIRRYDDDQKMRETCNTVIKMIDSGCWEIFSKDEKLIKRLSQKYKNIEFL